MKSQRAAEWPTGESSEGMGMSQGVAAPAARSSSKFPRAVGVSVARQICALLTPATSRIVVAGSLRRMKPEVGDIEICYIPMTDLRKAPGDMFSIINVNLADEAIGSMMSLGILAKRRNSAGSVMFGPKNKLMVHVETGLPVDLFSTTSEAWFNYLVCRTGPAESNVRIAKAAQRMGWKWNPYGDGFSRGGEVERMDSEQAVFKFVGLPYREPKDRR